jgi:hypothetical protein
VLALVGAVGAVGVVGAVEAVTVTVTIFDVEPTAFVAVRV